MDDPKPNDSSGTDLLSAVQGALPQAVKMLAAARKTVPFIDFSLGVVGLSAAAAIIAFFQGYSELAILSIGAVFVGSIVLFSISRLATSKSQSAHIAGNVVLWVSIAVFVSFAGFTVSAVAVGWPCNWAAAIHVQSTCSPQPTKTPSVENNVSDAVPGAGELGVPMGPDPYRIGIGWLEMWAVDGSDRKLVRTATASVIDSLSGLLISSSLPDYFPASSEPHYRADFTFGPADDTVKVKKCENELRLCQYKANPIKVDVGYLSADCSNITVGDAIETTTRTSSGSSLSTYEGKISQVSDIGTRFGTTFSFLDVQEGQPVFRNEKLIGFISSSSSSGVFLEDTNLVLHRLGLASYC